MKSFSDQLVEAIRRKGNRCVVGLDPHMEVRFLRPGRGAPAREAVHFIITSF
jgi:gamma-glutamyl-gamma-aminobutyrate hydrolase PuuD